MMMVRAFALMRISLLKSQYKGNEMFRLITCDINWKNITCYKAETLKELYEITHSTLSFKDFLTYSSIYYQGELL